MPTKFTAENTKPTQENLKKLFGAVTESGMTPQQVLDRMQHAIAYRFLTAKFGDGITSIPQLKITQAGGNKLGIKSMKGVFNSNRGPFTFTIEGGDVRYKPAQRKRGDEQGAEFRSMTPGFDSFASRTDDSKPCVCIVSKHGFDIGLQYRPGDMRHGRKLTVGYGHIRGVRGADGMSADVYLGPDLDSDRVFVVRQLDYDTGEFDEHKIMMGFNNLQKAEQAYKKNMTAKMFGGIREITEGDVAKLDGEGFRSKTPGAGYVYDIEEPQLPIVDRKSRSFTPQQSEKIGFVMREFKAGTLRSSSGKIVTDPDQAKAIAFSEAGLKQTDDMGLPSHYFSMQDADPDPRLARFGLAGYNKPKRTPSHPSKSHVVLAKEGDTVKLIRFGQQGVSGSPPSEGESKSEAARRKSFKARHAKNIAKGKLSAAYWADKVKWDEADQSDQMDAYEDMTDKQRYEFDEALRELDAQGPYTKDEVAYTHPAPDRDRGVKCFNCAYKAVDSPEAGPMRCVLVDGPILADGVCTEAIIPPKFLSDAEPAVGINSLSQSPDVSMLEKQDKACGESFIPDDHDCNVGEEGESKQNPLQKFMGWMGGQNPEKTKKIAVMGGYTALLAGAIAFGVAGQASAKAARRQAKSASFSPRPAQMPPTAEQAVDRFMDDYLKPGEMADIIKDFLKMQEEKGAPGFTPRPRPRSYSPMSSEEVDEVLRNVLGDDYERLVGGQTDAADFDMELLPPAAAAADVEIVTKGFKAATDKTVTAVPMVMEQGNALTGLVKSGDDYYEVSLTRGEKGIAVRTKEVELAEFAKEIWTQSRADKACGESFIPDDHECTKEEEEKQPKAEPAPKRKTSSRQVSKEGALRLAAQVFGIAAGAYLLEEGMVMGADRIITPAVRARRRPLGEQFVEVMQRAAEPAARAVSAAQKELDAKMAAGIFLKEGRDIYRTRAPGFAPDRKRGREMLRAAMGDEFDRVGAQRIELGSRLIGKDLSAQGKDLMLDARFYGRQGQPLDASQFEGNRFDIDRDRVAQRFISNQDVERTLGKGGFGQVVQLKNGNALKVGLIAEDLELNVLMGEAGIGPKIEDFGMIPNSAAQFIEMETIDFDPVWRDDKSFPRMDVDSEDLAESIAQMHRAGVSHGDLHLRNVGTDANGKVRIIDFGLAEFHPDDFYSKVVDDLARVDGRGGSRGLFSGPEAGPTALQANRLMFDHNNLIASNLKGDEYRAAKREIGRQWLEFISDDEATV